MSAFELPDEAGWVLDAPGASPHKLARCLPASLRKHVNAQAFLRACHQHARTVATLAEHMRRAPAAEVRDSLLDVETCAGKLGLAIRGLAGTDAQRAVVDTLATLSLGASAIEHGESLFVAVDELGFPGLNELLARMERDLATLAALTARVGADAQSLALLAEAAALEIPTTRNPARGPERLLVRLIVRSFIANFAARPPGRSWFADDFCATVARAIGLTVGHTLVGQIVAEADAPPRISRRQQRPPPHGI